MQVSSVIHHIDDVMILETEEQAWTDLSAAVTHITNQTWLIRPAEVQRPALMVEFLGITWIGATWNILQATKNNLLSLSFLRTNQEAQLLLNLF